MMRRYASLCGRLALRTINGTACSMPRSAFLLRAGVASSSCGSSCGSLQLQGRAASVVACPAVLRLPLPTSPVTGIGKAVTLEQVAAVYGVSVARLHEVQPPRMIIFTKIDLPRNTFAPLIQTVTDTTPDLRLIEKKVHDALTGGEKSGNGAPDFVKGARTHFETKEWASVEELVQFYEEVLFPIRYYHAQYEQHLLNSYQMKDVLKRGLTAFKQEELDKNKELLEKEKAGMEKCLASVAEFVKESFTTDICNDIVNILRIAGEKYEHASAMAVKVLEDMNMMKIPYNEVTRELISIVTFHDGPFDNSPLLFEIIEYPERGEIALDLGNKEKTDLEASSTEILKVISQRHQTILDDGKLLRSTETHPNLQRSPE